MNKYVAALLALLLACMPLCALAQESATPAGDNLTEPELRRLIGSARAAYQAKYEEYRTISMMNGQSEVLLTVPLRVGAPSGLIGSMEVGMEAWLDLPVDAETAAAEARDITLGAMELSKVLMNFRLVNENHAPGLAGVHVADSWLVCKDLGDGATFTLAPLRFLTTGDASLDERVYMVYCLYGEETVDAWICAENELVYRLLKSIMPEGGGNELDADTIGAWVTAYEKEHPDEVIQTERRTAAERGFEGIITIVSSGNVNLRQGPSADARQAGRAQPGEMFDTMGLEKGWYAIALADGSTGYVAGNLAEFTPYQ